MNERILIILNKYEKRQEVNLTVPSFYNIRRAKNLITSEFVLVKENKLIYTINGISYLILKLE
jgi:hypothetical protein